MEVEDVPYCNTCVGQTKYLGKPPCEDCHGTGRDWDSVKEYMKQLVANCGHNNETLLDENIVQCLDCGTIFI